MRKVTLQRVKKAIKRRVRLYHPSHLVWNADQRLRKYQMKFLASPLVEKIKRDLALPPSHNGPCLITLTFGSRQFGNRDNLLPQFLQSFLSMTDDPSRAEILIKIDDNDDLLFFHKLKKKYQNTLRLRFIVTPQGRGYHDIFIWHADLFRMRHPTTRALFILSEDAEFCHKHWDKDLFSAVKDLEHNYFLATPCSLEETTRIIGPNPATPIPIYWVAGTDFPIIGVDILKCSEMVASKYPGWRCTGNTYSVEGFSADLIRRVWEKYRVNLHIRIPEFALRRGITSWTDNPERSKTRTDSLIKFFSPETQSVREEMADVIRLQYLQSKQLQLKDS